jgi:hypothetical protein
MCLVNPDDLIGTCDVLKKVVFEIFNSHNLTKIQRKIVRFSIHGSSRVAKNIQGCVFYN